MLFEAARDFNIDLSNSWMIGDGKMISLQEKQLDVKLR